MALGLLDAPEMRPEGEREAPGRFLPVTGLTDLPRIEQERLGVPAVPVGSQAQRTTTEAFPDLAQEGEIYQEASGSMPSQLVYGTGRAFMHGGNFAVNLGKELYRKTQYGEDDPNWTRDARGDFIDKNAGRIPPNQIWRYWGTRNAAEAAALLSDQEADIKAMRINAAMGGAMHFTTSAIAGLVDLDTPLMFATGGLSAAAKVGLNATRMGRIASGAASGAAIGAALGTIDYVSNPNATADDIVMTAFMGGGLSMAGAAFRRTTPANTPDLIPEQSVPNRTYAEASPDVAHDMNTRAMNEYGESIQSGRREPTPPSAEPTWTFKTTETPDAPREAPAAFRLDENTLPDSGEVGGGFGQRGTSTVGAAGASNRTGPGVDTITNPIHADLIAQAETAVKRDGWANELDEFTLNTKNAVTEAAGRAALNFNKMVGKLGLGDDWGRFMSSSSDVAKKMAYDLFESASGIARNATSAAALREGFRMEMALALDPYHNAMRTWKAQERGISATKQFFTLWDEKVRNATRDFNEEVISELMSRFHGTPNTKAVHPEVKRAADAWDKLMELDIDIGKGRGAQDISIAAYRDLKKRTGYVQQNWSGINMRNYIDKRIANGASESLGRRELVQAIDENYKSLHPTLDPELRRKYATAVVDRALINRTSISRDILGLLNGDEATVVRDGLRRNGITDHEIDRIIEALIGSREQKQRPGHTQERIDVDFRAVSSNGVRMMDLLDTDLFSMGHKRIAKTSGMAALARKGIASRVDFENLAGAALSEQKAKGALLPAQDRNLVDKVRDFRDRERELTMQDFEDMYSYFSGGAIAGGASPMVARIRKVTNLSLMNQLGLTQFGEYGAIAGNVGFRRFLEHTGNDIRSMLTGKNTPLMDELRHTAFYVPEEKVHRADMMFEYDKLTHGSDMSARLDQSLNKLSDLQGYLSGFYAVRAAQQRLVLSAGTSKVFEGIKKGADQFSDARLKDMGIDLPNLRKYVDDGTVEFDANNNLIRLNMDRWKYEDVEGFRAAMTRTTNQLVQKAMAGESNAMFHKDGLAQLFWQFKSFPMLAMTKQFGRNMKMADQHALQTFVWGTVFSSMAFAAKQAVNGNTDNLTTNKIVRGGLNYANMTGWMPMWVDPTASLLGLDDYNMSGYSSHGQGLSVLSMPAAFTAMDRLVQAPKALVKVAGAAVGIGEYTNADINALKVIPIAGQIYGMNAILNYAKH